MKRFEVVFEGVVFNIDNGGTSAALIPEELESHLSAVMDSLLDLNADDATVGAALAAGQVEISVSVEADSVAGAVDAGFAVIRSAIHAAGGATPGWDMDFVSVRSVLVDEEAENLVNA